MMVCLQLGCYIISRGHNGTSSHFQPWRTNDDNVSFYGCPHCERLKTTWAFQPIQFCGVVEEEAGAANLRTNFLNVLLFLDGEHHLHWCAEAQLGSGATSEIVAVRHWLKPRERLGGVLSTTVGIVTFG